MTLRNRNPHSIEPPQASVVQGAGGSHLEGEFEWTMGGWTITIRGLTFHEVVSLADEARRIVADQGVTHE